MPAKLDTPAFIVRARACHGDRYDYAQVVYTTSRKPVVITCLTHGAFETTPNSHLNGTGCPKCGVLASGQDKRDTQTVFERKARAVHGDRYAYGHYTHRGKKMSITCSVHGMFHQLPGNHLKGQGCPACGKQMSSHRSRPDRLSTFLQQAHSAHGDRYDYSQAIYTNNSTPITILCPTHGAFDQRPEVHAQGMGCPECGIKLSATHRRINLATFIARAHSAHGDKYDYREAQVDGQQGKTTIICPHHGRFEQCVRHHMQGIGCPSCASHISKPNREIADYLRILGVEALLEMPLPGETKKKVDVFLPALNIAIEHHGLRWHSTAVMEEREARQKHYARRMACEAAGWRYVAIYEDEWRDRRALCERYLRNLVGQAPRCYARKLRLGAPTSAEAREFYNEHHFLSAGQCGTRHAGLYDAEGHLLACMSFGKPTERRGVVAQNTASLTRYATDGHAIPGAAQRLFKALVRPEERVISYVDHDKFTGTVYEHLGFTHEAHLLPDYWTVWGNRQRRHKTATKRSNLAKLPGFDPELTEFENANRMGLHRIYHSGRSRVVRRAQLDVQHEAQYPPKQRPS